jgi:photosystem II stability/assembly factor-like uncharacterized protein
VQSVDHPIGPRAASRVLLVAACLAVAWLAAATATRSEAASGDVVVTTDITSATTLDSTGCAPGVPQRTSFGVVQPGTGATTSQDCSVLFGSSNDTSTLRAYQPDGRGAAMTAPATTMATAVSWDNRAQDADMASSSTGWLATDGPSSSSRLFRTTDGGVTWNAVVDSDITAGMRAVDAVSTTVGWATGLAAPVLRTTDGSNWSPVALPPGASSIHDIAAASASNAWIAGSQSVAGHSQPRIWRTTDGGGNWTATYGPATDDVSATFVVATSSTSVWAATSNGRILRSTDGATFNDVGVNLGSITAFAALDATHAAAVGGNGSVAVTTNGSSWTVRASIERDQVGGAAFSPNGDLYLVGQLGAIQRTTDYGVTWSTVANPHEGTTFAQVASPANGQVIVLANARTVITTSDYGSTWSLWRASAGPVNWRSVDGVDSSRLWMVGGSGAIRTSTDGGTTWTAQASPTTNALYEVVALDKRRAVAVGAAGTIVRTTDGGATWTAVDSGTSARLRAVGATADGTTVLAAGDGGTVVVSVDRGASWSPVATGVTDSITAVAAWDSSHWILATPTIVVRTTTDAGATWTTRSGTGAAEGFADAVAMPGTNVAYLVWDDNLSRTADGGATWTSSEMPSGGQIFDIDVVATGTADVVWAAGEGTRMMRGEADGTDWTQVAGTTSAAAYQGIVALGPDSVVAAGDGNHVAVTAQSGTTVPDYSGTQWGSSSGLFGVCLRAAPGATNTWPTTGTCPMADGTNWRALPLDPSLATSKVADLAAPGTTTASFRFGLFVPAAQAPGTYRAPVAFEVVAPSG